MICPFTNADCSKPQCGFNNGYGRCRMISQKKEILKKTKNHEYETKCRRCGTMTTWHFGDCLSTTLSDFLKWAYQAMTFPHNSYCKKCKKETVQDITYFTKHPTQTL